MDKKLTLEIKITPNPYRKNGWWVEVDDIGVPDFTVFAGSAEAAAGVVKHFIYNELDGYEDIYDDDSLMPDTKDTDDEGGE